MRAYLAQFTRPIFLVTSAVAALVLSVATVVVLRTVPDPEATLDILWGAGIGGGILATLWSHRRSSLILSGDSAVRFGLNLDEIMDRAMFIRHSPTTFRPRFYRFIGAAGNVVVTQGVDHVCTVEGPHFLIAALARRLRLERFPFAS